MQTDQSGGAGFYPEECDPAGADCIPCVRATAAETKALAGTMDASGAGRLFDLMYAYPACQQVKHTFLWACGFRPPSMGASPARELVQIRETAA
jgi:hypothetical protein